MSRGACSREELAGLYERRFSMVYQICLVLMKSIPDAEDAAQTVFRKVMEQPRDGEIWEQVAGLPEPQRLVLYLHYYQGYTTGEISDMLRENHSTVRSRLVQARKKLKLKLEEEGYGQT